jgi:hypothetical protein
MDIRRTLLIKDVVRAEGGLLAIEPVTRVAACAVISNPLAGMAVEDLQDLIQLGSKLGEYLVSEALTLISKPVVSYGKAAIVGTAGDIEHAAAILHPLMGKPIRAAIGGGQAVIPSNAKIGSVGTTIDVPIGHKHNSWSFDQIDTISVTIPGAPRSDEIVVILVLSDGGRPRPRISIVGG